MKHFVAVVALSTLVFLKPVLADIDWNDPEHTMPPATYKKWKEIQSQTQLFSKFRMTGESALAKGEYATAETAFKSALNIMPGHEYAEELLARTLGAEGKTDEAIAMYRERLYNAHSGQTTPQEQTYVGRNIPSLVSGPETWHACMEYTVLLAQTSQWREAVSVYERTLPRIEDYTGTHYPKINAHFDADSPNPAGLEAAAHVVNGLQYHIGNTVMDTQLSAVAEFEQAHKLAPSWPLATYYYAYGLEHAGRDREAKAAYQEVAKTGDGKLKELADQYVKAHAVTFQP
jgi:tetratricopeptide (TPR) repeat protein